jgi:hypothetical protein
MDYSVSVRCCENVCWQTVGWQWTSALAPLFRLSGVMSQYCIQAWRLIILTRTFIYLSVYWCIVYLTTVAVTQLMFDDGKQRIGKRAWSWPSLRYHPITFLTEEGKLSQAGYRCTECYSLTQTCSVCKQMVQNWTKITAIKWTKKFKLNLESSSNLCTNFYPFLNSHWN